MENEKKDIIYLKKQMKLLKEACIIKSFSDRKNIIDELLKYDWNIGVKSELKNIYVLLFSSDFENALERINLMLKRISGIYSYNLNLKGDLL